VAVAVEMVKCDRHSNQSGWALSDERTTRWTIKGDGNRLTTVTSTSAIAVPVVIDGVSFRPLRDLRAVSLGDAHAWNSPLGTAAPAPPETTINTPNSPPPSALAQ